MSVVRGKPFSGIKTQRTSAVERELFRDDEVEPRATDPTIVYYLCAEDETLLYVGVTKNLKHRLQRHSESSPWWPDVAYNKTQVLPSRAAALIREREAILLLEPKHNVQGRAVRKRCRTAGCNDVAHIRGLCLACDRWAKNHGHERERRP